MERSIARRLGAQRRRRGGEKGLWNSYPLPGGETSFVVDTIPGAVTYRISVRAFDVVSGMTRQ